MGRVARLMSLAVSTEAKSCCTKRLPCMHVNNKDYDERTMTRRCLKTGTL